MQRTKTTLQIFLLNILLVLISISFTGIVSAGNNIWTSNGPTVTADVLTGTNVYSLVINPITPTNLYLGTISHGVYKSTDGGSIWSAVNFGLTNNDIYALAIDPLTPSTLYAGTYGGGVFKSTNGGESRSASNSGLTRTDIISLAINPTSPTTLYLGTDGGGVFKSTNGGGNWSVVNNGLTGTQYHCPGD